MKLLKKVVVVLMFVLTTSSYMFSFEIYVRDMVGKTTSYAHTTVPLPSVVKANSDWVPLCKIDISTDTGNENYVLTAATITIRDLSNFDFFEDISSIRLFYDDQSGNYTTASTKTWYGSYKENLVDVAPVLISSGVQASTPYWKIYFEFTGGNRKNVGSSPNVWYTLYFCIKTSGQITNNDQFSLRTLPGDLVLDINGNTETPALPTFTKLAADTFPPQLVAAYSLNPENGTTLTVYNYDTYNIYTTTTDANNPYANNDINIKIRLAESTSTMTNNGIVPLNNLIILDTAGIDGGNPSNIKSVFYLGSLGPNEFSINYTIIQTTVNSPTTAIPLKIKVRDAAGNETEFDGSFRCFIDRTKPSTPVILSPSAGSWIGPISPQLSWSEVNEPNISAYYLIFSTCNIVEDFLTNSDLGYRWVSNTIITVWGYSSDS